MVIAAWTDLDTDPGLFNLLKSRDSHVKVEMMTDSLSEGCRVIKWVMLYY